MLEKYSLQSWVCLSLFIFSCSFGYSQEKKTLEEIINKYIYAYQLSPENKFRLAAYAELKATLSADHRAIVIPFGGLGTLTMFPRNCLLRTYDNQIFHLSLSHTSSTKAFDRKIGDIFESILLMSNDKADPGKIAFVDKHLARKNIEPFEKIYLRHILLRYGKFHPEKKYVELHTDWLPERNTQYQKPGSLHLVRRQNTPLKIKLDEKILRGYYINAGGTVYVENQKQSRYFATGETYDYNVAAFKLFLQKLFIQSVQYIMKTESKRASQHIFHDDKGNKAVAPKKVMPFVSDISSQTVPSHVVKINNRKSAASGEIKALYHPDSWMPMMLNTLRSNDVNIGDPDVIQYFVNEPYFPKLYDLLLPNEKTKVDIYKGRSVPRS
ncbi:MAG: hypothetical protein AAF587_19500 [Bacteroidota bacterium]